VNAPATGGFAHDALFFGADDELIAAAAPFLRAGLDADEAVLLACSDRNLELLTDALGWDPRVGLLPHSRIYDRPAAAIAAFQRIVHDQLDSGARRIRVLGEVKFGHTESEWLEWNRYEAVVNRALVGYPLWTVCLYDTGQLPSQVLQAGHRTHRTVRTATSRGMSRSYVDPGEFLRASRRTIADPLDQTEPQLRFDDPMPTDLSNMRRAINRAGVVGSALPTETVYEFVFAIIEVTTNALIHGRPPVQVRFWSTPTRLLCKVTDHGAGFDDPFAGYILTPEGFPDGGAGLCLARQFCDHLDFSHDSGRFTVRLEAGS
jgi:anti-sigma regulatory factor (Ser/Thr protein kinase)